MSEQLPLVLCEKTENEKGRKGEIGDSEKQKKTPKVLSSVCVCLERKGGKAAREASVIRCCSFHERGEIILNTDTQ